MRTFPLLALALAGCTTALGDAGMEPAPLSSEVSRLDPSAGAAERETAAALDRIARLNPDVNAVIAVDPTALEQARFQDRIRRSRGPLFGRPVLIKDNIEARGPLPTTAGSMALLNNVTNRDAPLVANLRNAGAVIVGKTNLSEWANIRASDSISGWSAVGGQTRNPYALDRNPCGSSSGSGAAVGAGMVDIAIGTETDGSVTCPAAVNGIVGMKPTVGLVSRTHVIPISHSQDTAGPMTRTVRDAALTLTAMAGSDPADEATREADRRRVNYAAGLSPDALRGKRIGVMRFATGFGTDAAFEAALETLKAQGATLVDIKEGPNRGEIGRNEFAVLLTELKQDLNAYLATTPPEVTTRTLAQVIAFNEAQRDRELGLFGQDTFVQAEATKGYDADYRRARATSLRLAGPEGIDKMLRQHKVVALVGPTMPAAWPIDPVHGDAYPGAGAGGLAAVAGYPHLTVPMGTVEGLPVGLSFIGPKWSDALMLQLGYAFEQARGPLPAPLFLPSLSVDPRTRELLEPLAR